MTNTDVQSLSHDDFHLTAAFLIALAATLGALFIREAGGVSAYADGSPYDPRYELAPKPLLVTADAALHERLRPFV